jgi:GAF domain-containing protein
MMSDSAIRFLQQENLRLRNEIENLTKQNQRLQLHLTKITDLYWANQRIATEEDPLEVISQLLYQIINVIEAGDGSISRLDEETNELVFLFSHGELQQQLPGHRIKSDLGIAGWVVENHQPIIVNNPRQDWRFSQEVDDEFNFYSRSIVSVPIISYDQLLGVIQLVNKQDNEFTEADIALLLILGQVTATAMQAVESRSELELE